MSEWTLKDLWWEAAPVICVLAAVGAAVVLYCVLGVGSICARVLGRVVSYFPDDQ